MTVSPVGQLVQRGIDVELMSRSLGFAALATLTLVPLLLLIAAVDPGSGLGAGQWLVRVLGVAPSSRRPIADLFGSPAEALRRTTAFGFVGLAVFGLSFGSALQTGYEKAWSLPAAKWRSAWRHVMWLAVFIAFLILAIKLDGHSQTDAEQTLAGIGELVLSLIFFLWSQRFLTNGRVRWRALLPSSVATAIGLLGLHIFSSLVFSPLIASNAVTYGPFGTVLVIQSWLVGVGFVVYGGVLVGRVFHEHTTAARVRRDS
ncbi:membrane protein [Streptomyces sp. DvalAA-14]|uniref:YhjD/YihY/BrkB family envelope integrity protein n=1 Tax=unclassified Streptomyces TaxID=2593676 RepID=UPI00081B4C1A|nr:MULTISPECIES: YhjD/YihY/BrkB family envelope integrity protein [unclassified Streptomyces]SCE34361.1 membrane protein [Streptomyces sp. DvalAA-14]